MATVYWDAAARAAGDTFTIGNGTDMTIRTDTRWHAGSPVNMTGYIGSISDYPNNSRGTFSIDGTKVRWMSYDTGSGNVPAIGTTITQGGVSGYLLGVWADYTSAPTAVGAAMPASGYLKFREVTGGQFAIGALTGIGANATEADRVGWIEVVGGTTSDIRLSIGANVNIAGDWFELGTTNGVIGQIVQIPTMAGGALTSVPAVQIETSVGSGIFEWFSSLTTTNFTTTNLINDKRAKFVRYISNGQIMIGATSDAAAAGYLPEAGLRIRIPNIFLRSCTSAAPTTNAVISTLVCFGFGNSSINYCSSYNVDKVLSDWKLNISYHKGAVFKNSSFYGGSLSSLTQYGENEFNGVCFSGLITSNIYMSNYVNLKLINSTICGTTIDLVTCSNFLIDNCYFYRQDSGGTTGRINLSQCPSGNITNIKTVGVSIYFVGSKNITVDGHDYCVATSGNTAASTRTGDYCANFTGGSSNINYTNLTFGNFGHFPIAFPYNQVFGIANAENINIYNIGSLESPATVFHATIAPSHIFVLSNQTSMSNISIKRVFFGKCRTGFVGAGGSIPTNVSFKNVGFPTQDLNFTSLLLNNTTVNGYVCSSSSPSNFVDLSNSPSSLTFFDTIGTTNGNVYCETSIPYTVLYKTSSSGATILGTSNISFGPYTSTLDFAILECPFFIKGHTAITNVVFIKTAITEVLYQIDTGSGWNGTWKLTTAANLSTEIINPAIGFKIKYKIYNTDTTGSNSSFTSVRLITTVPSIANQPTYFYPLTEYALAFTGLIPGSEVRVYSGTDPATAVEVGGTEATGGSTFSLSHSVAGNTGTIVILAMGYQPIYLPYTFKATDDSILIQPVVDRNYVNPV